MATGHVTETLYCQYLSVEFKESSGTDILPYVDLLNYEAAKNLSVSRKTVSD